MQQRFLTWLSVNHPDDDIRRRGRNSIYLSIAVIITCLLALPITLAPIRGTTLLATVGIFALVIGAQVGLIALARRGLVTLAGIISLGIATVAIIGSILGGSTLGGAPYYFALLALMAGMVFPARFILIGLIINPAVIALIWYALPNTSLQPVPAPLVIVSSIALSIFATVFATLGAWSSEQSLRAARQSRAELEHAKRQLEQGVSLLELRVAERTADLRSALDDRERKSQALEESLATQQRLTQLLLDVSIPVLPVRHDTLVAPLIGVIDGERADELLGRVLGQIETQRARTLILDITGVAIIDTAIAQTLIQVTQAAGLLGARTALVGVRPEVAQTLVSLGVDLSTIRTEATLAQAIATM